MGRATTPANDTLDDADGDDWLGSSTQLGASGSSTPVPPAFRQGLHSVQELSEDAAPLTGEACLAGVLLYIAGSNNPNLQLRLLCLKAVMIRKGPMFPLCSTCLIMSPLFSLSAHPLDHTPF